MRFAIADPPYLGRAARHYGEGANLSTDFGSGPARAATGRSPVTRRTTEHPEAADWDRPERHQQLVAELDAEYDGYAIAAHQSSVKTYLEVLPDDHRIAVWHDTRSVPGGSRIMGCWEPVFIVTPHTGAPRPGGAVKDVLIAPHPEVGHVGAKPVAWTQWVLALLGADPLTDDIVDLFHGSGQVAHVLNQGSLI